MEKLIVYRCLLLFLQFYIEGRADSSGAAKNPRFRGPPQNDKRTKVFLLAKNILSETDILPELHFNDIAENLSIVFHYVVLFSINIMYEIRSMINTSD